MANRFWVGGSGNWDATSTANWSATSGGSAGASAPTSADNVIFDANSNVGTGAFTVTVTGTTSAPAVCNDFSTGGAGGALDGAMTLTMGATAFLDVYGSMTLPATNFSISGTAGANIRYMATTTGKTLTTNGVSFGNVAVTFNGIGGEWTLGSALTCLTALLSAGIFRTNNFNVTCSVNFQITNAATNKEMYLGSSTVTIGGSLVFQLVTTTFDAGTSQITLTNNTSNLSTSLNAITFYNVSFTGSAINLVVISGTNTFNNLTFTSRPSTGISNISLNANQTVNGTLTFGTANTAIRRMFMYSDVVGTSRTITLNGSLATLADVDFRDITAAGTTGTWSGTRLGNCGGNSNITTATPKTVYRVGTGNWSATQWSLSSGGAVDVNNFPLAQDTAIFDTGTTTGTHTIDAGWNIGTLNMSALNVAVTLATGTTRPTFYGNFTLDADVTLSGTGRFLFSGQNVTQEITSAGISIPQQIQIDSETTIFKLLDALTITVATESITHLAGVLDLNGYNLTVGSFYSGNSITVRRIDFGTNKIIITGNNTTVLQNAFYTNFSYTGTPRFELTYSGSVGTRQIDLGRAGGATESNVVDVYITAGSDILDLRNIGSSIYRNLDFTGFTGSTSANQQLVIYGNLTYSSGMTVSSGTSLTFLKSSGTQTFTTNGKTIDFPVTKQNAGTLQLLDACTLGSTRTFTLTQGTLDLNGFDLTCGAFSSNNSNTRAIAFGTKKIVVTGNATTVWTQDTTTNFSISGTPRVEFSYSGSTGTRTIIGSSVFDPTKCIDMYVTSGSDILTGLTRGFGIIDLTGFSGTFNNSGWVAYKNFIVSGTCTLAAGTTALTFGALTGTQSITSAAKTFDFPVTKQGAGTLQLLDACTIGSTRTLTHTAGTLDLNDFDLTTGLYSSTGSTARQLDFGTGDLNITGATFTVSGSNFTTAGTGSVSMNSASSKTFAGGGFSYKVLNQGGAGELIITGTNTFTNITNTNATTSTITFPNVTTTVSDFTVSGSAGNLVTLRRTGASGTFTLNYTGASATFVDYVSISNSTATPSSKFYAGVNSTDGGGNTGWTFNYAPTTMYWVNGSGTWSTTSKTNWAAFSGSAGGNVVPTSSTNVIFDTNSDSGSAFTVTIDNGVCNNLDASAINQTMTINYNSKILSVYGTTFTGASTGLIAKTGTGYIDMISASNKTFAGGGNIYGKIRNAGAGDLTITGANTFDDIANSTQPCTIKLPSGVITKVVDFNLNGTFGNYVTLKSTTDGVQATLEYI